MNPEINQATFQEYLRSLHVPEVRDLAWVVGAPPLRQRTRWCQLVFVFRLESGWPVHPGIHPPPFIVGIVLALPPVGIGV